MANLAAIRSVGASLEKHFNNAYRNALFPNGVTKPACTFTVTTIGGLNDKDIATETSTQVLIVLHRVGMNPHLRNSGYLSDRDRQPTPVSVELHYLFSFWASSAENEQLVLAWTLRELQATTVLDRSILSSDAGWTAEEIVQLVPQELSTEEMMRIWDALQPDYRLSLSYIARVVRIDPDPQQPHRPVVASRFASAAPTEGAS
jgi:hypothetical protein